MAKSQKSLSERIAEADDRGGRLLADANEADRSNKLRGNS